MFKTFRRRTHADIDDAILSSLGEAVVAFDTNKKCIVFNREAERLLVRKQKEAIGHPARLVLPLFTEKRKPLSDSQFPIIRVLASGHTYRSKTPPNIFVKSTQGHIFPIDLTVTPMKSGTRLLGAVAVFQDRTVHTEMDQMKSDFVSLVSHQLRTPLSSIRWFLEILAREVKGQLNEEQERFVASARDGVARMNTLINTLLNITRLESGRMKVSPRATRLSSFLQSLVKEMDMVARARNVKLTFTKKITGRDTLNLDRSLLTEVVSNLLSNAMMYADPKKKEKIVDVALHVSKGKVSISIRDNGIGIPDKDQFHLFEKFHRAENAQALMTSGNGLGLYMVKKILDDTSGHILFESEEGKGTAFTIILPRAGMKKRAGTSTLALK
ncbi:MAG: ATP-binding protein [Candidatus Kerfeldbacteria bacterium]|nr:ATP-binding protein [Candidatus Kerfeldbacteria bacterium]